MRPALILILALVFTVGCRKEPKGEAPGLPAADSWQSPTEGSGANPHGGADPHAGLPKDDPHAGLNIGMPGQNPGLPQLPPPDPSRPIDSSKFVEGKIVATEKTEKLIKPGAILFLSLRPIDPATGEVIGSPLAVDRIDIDKLPKTFRLDETKAMSAGTQFQGHVIVVARVDSDGDAITKMSGDVEGTVQAKIPAKDLTLTLDRVLP
jgi:hypothetical protein